MDFHTFELTSEKNLTIVLRGMSVEIKEEETKPIRLPNSKDLMYESQHWNSPPRSRGTVQRLQIHLRIQTLLPTLSKKEK